MCVAKIQNNHQSKFKNENKVAKISRQGKNVSRKCAPGVWACPQDINQKYGEFCSCPDGQPQQVWFVFLLT
jgi:hypothetical protein